MDHRGSFIWSPRDGGPPFRILFWDGRLDPHRTGTDHTQRLLDAYLEAGVAGLKSLIGDWCAVIHDAVQDCLILASDYSGSRPLYYSRAGQQVQWATRIELLAGQATSSEIDEDYAAHYLTTGGHPQRTLWRNVSVVPAGCAVTLRERSEELHAFWTAPVSETTAFPNDSDYEERFRELLHEAVAARLQEPVPAIAELSGGLDSSTVVCLAARLIRDALVPATHLFTVSFVHRESGDVPFIRHVRDATAVHGIELSTERYPLVDNSPVTMPLDGWSPVYDAVAAFAHDVNARTILTGQAGDTVTGNFIDDSLQVAGAMRQLRPWRALTESIAWSLTSRRPVPSILFNSGRLAFFPQTSRSTIERHLSQGDETSLTAACLSKVADSSLLFDEWMEAPPERRRHFLQVSMLRQLRGLQPLEPVRGLNYTHPFAHRPLVEFLLTIPANMVCRPGEPRRLMRRALANLLPPRIVSRRSKALFNVPWLRALQPLASALLSSNRRHVVERGWVDGPSFCYRLRRLVNGLACNESQLRRLILLECWLRRLDPIHSPIIAGAKS